MTYYVLVPTTEARGVEYKKLSPLGESLLERLSGKKTREVHQTVLTFEDSDILSRLREDDTLYITAHGSTVDIGSSNDNVSYTAETLASALYHAGLSPTIGTIKLMTCYSGVSKEDVKILHPRYPKLYEALENQKVCFAELFQSKITGLGYANTDVCGYIGEVGEARKRRGLESCITYLSGTPKAITIKAKDGQQWFFGRHHSEEEQEAREEENENVRYVAKLRT